MAYYRSMRGLLGRYAVAISLTVLLLAWFGIAAPHFTVLRDHVLLSSPVMLLNVLFGLHTAFGATGREPVPLAGRIVAALIALSCLSGFAGIGWSMGTLPLSLILLSGQILAMHREETPQQPITA